MASLSLAQSELMIMLATCGPELSVNIEAGSIGLSRPRDSTGGAGAAGGRARPGAGRGAPLPSARCERSRAMAPAAIGWLQERKHIDRGVAAATAAIPCSLEPPYAYAHGLTMNARARAARPRAIASQVDPPGIHCVYNWHCEAR